LEEKLAVMEAEAKETYDRFLRVSAEFENFKKRSTREMSDFRKYAAVVVFSGRRRRWATGKSEFLLPISYACYVVYCVLS